MAEGEHSQVRNYRPRLEVDEKKVTGFSSTWQETIQEKKNYRNHRRFIGTMQPGSRESSF